MLTSHQSHRPSDDRAFTIVASHQGERERTKHVLTVKDFFLDVTDHSYSYFLSQIQVKWPWLSSKDWATAVPSGSEKGNS